MLATRCHDQSTSLQVLKAARSCDSMDVASGSKAECLAALDRCRSVRWGAGGVRACGRARWAHVRSRVRVRVRVSRGEAIEHCNVPVQI